MPSQEDIDTQLQLLATHRRTLALYLQQLAQLGGTAYAHPAVLNGIYEAREQIRRSKATLRSWQITVDDHPDDEPSPSIPLSRYSRTARWLLPALGLVLVMLASIGLFRSLLQSQSGHSLADTTIPRTASTLPSNQPGQEALTSPAQADDRLIKTIPLRDKVSDMALTPDGKHLFATSVNQEFIRVVRVIDGEVEDNFPAPGVTGMAFSPDGKLLATADFGPEVKLWNIADRQVFHKLNTTTVPSTLAFAPAAGQILAIGLRDGTIQLWRIDETQPFRILRGHTDRVTSIAFAHDGLTLASGSMDTTVRLWRMTDGEPLATLHDHLDRIATVAFSTDDQTLASGSWDKTVKLWRVSDRTLVQTFESLTGAVTSMALVPNGQVLVAGLDDGNMQIWRVGSNTRPQIFKGHTDVVDRLVFTGDGRTLASGSRDGTVKVWRVEP